MRKTVLLALALCMVLLASLGAQAFEMTIVHVNDIHSHLEACPGKLSFGGEGTYVNLGGWDRLKAKVDQVRANRKNVALLHAGDAVQGTLYFTKYKGKPEMEFMNLLGFDAMVLGNHEFDKGPQVLADFLGYARFPLLSANANTDAVKKLKAEVRPYTILEYNGEKVGVIGLTLKDTAVVSSPAPVSFADEAATARKYVAELEGKGIDKIIALTHLGYDRDLALAREVPGIDVIVGGHSHSLLDGVDDLAALGLRGSGLYPTVVKGSDGNDVYVVTSWEWAKAVGVLDLVFDGKGHVTRCGGNAVLLLSDSFRRKNAEGQKVELEGAERQKVYDIIAASPVAEVVASDKAAVELLAPYKAGIEAMRSEVIGEAAESLPHIRVPGVNTDGLSMPQGSYIAPLVCDSMLWKVNSVGMKVDMALQNAGGVRVDVPQGKITVGTAYTLMPFGNTLAVLGLTGAEFRAALETGATRGGGAFSYVAGARYTVDMNRPEGSRVTSVEVNKDGAWQPLKDDAAYRVVTNAYIAEGGDGYEVLKKAAGYRCDTGFVDAQAFMDYVRKVRVLKRPASTGITFIPKK
ncbi:bifunctional metallophosphatase/5'-nucleotidase [Salidesulfovibrio onnuriiensis]|uniref:bifunctional metallophosphatase/5'-nucleotidase n=1 Tax=Salidesulfovibrio onnuriiensis TaxID=2583823 RepID=UPI0011CC0E90|nr:5'-nucleotidase C-terminal domain-containing protein [Salidesulfovibrio onnuriiensis]